MTITSIRSCYPWIFNGEVIRVNMLRLILISLIGSLLCIIFGIFNIQEFAYIKWDKIELLSVYVEALNANDTWMTMLSEQ